MKCFIIQVSLSLTQSLRFNNNWIYKNVINNLEGKPRKKKKQTVKINYIYKQVCTIKSDILGRSSHTKKPFGGDFSKILVKFRSLHFLIHTYRKTPFIWIPFIQKHINQNQSHNFMRLIFITTSVVSAKLSVQYKAKLNKNFSKNLLFFLGT